MQDTEAASLSRPSRPARPSPTSAKPASRASETALVGSGEPRLPAAEAEPDGEDRLRTVLAQVCDARGDVGLHRRRCRLFDMRPVLEVLPALRRTGRPAEVVERDGGVAALG